jgi:hypothetical protein
MSTEQQLASFWAAVPVGEDSDRRKRLRREMQRLVVDVVSNPLENFRVQPFKVRAGRARLRHARPRKMVGALSART